MALGLFLGLIKHRPPVVSAGGGSPSVPTYYILGF